MPYTRCPVLSIATRGLVCSMTDTKKGRLATAFLPCLHNDYLMSYGTVTVAASRVTAVCANSLPFTVAFVPTAMFVFANITPAILVVAPAVPTMLTVRAGTQKTF